MAALHAPGGDAVTDAGMLHDGRWWRLRRRSKGDLACADGGFELGLWPRGGRV